MTSPASSKKGLLDAGAAHLLFFGQLLFGQTTLVAGVGAAVITAALALFFGLHRPPRTAVTHVQPDVLVARRLIRPGTSGKAPGLYETRVIPRAKIRPGAIVDSSVIAGKVAAVAIRPGEQLVTADFRPKTGYLARDEHGAGAPRASPQG